MTDEINTNIALETPTEQVVEAQPTSIENVVTETPTVESTATDTDHDTTATAIANEKKNKSMLNNKRFNYK